MGQYLKGIKRCPFCGAPMRHLYLEPPVDTEIEGDLWRFQTCQLNVCTRRELLSGELLVWDVLTNVRYSLIHRHKPSHFTVGGRAFTTLAEWIKSVVIGENDGSQLKTNG